MKRMWSKNELAKQVKEVKKDITTLVDAQGHERFIEGDIDLPEASPFTKLYGKWSLSGSHLLIVLCLSANNATDWSAGELTEITLPEWIDNKIVPLSSDVIERKSQVWYNNSAQTQNVNIYFSKTSGRLVLNMSAITFTDDRDTRIAFDLLIDNE